MSRQTLDGIIYGKRNFRMPKNGVNRLNKKVVRSDGKVFESIAAAARDAGFAHNAAFGLKVSQGKSINGFTYTCENISRTKRTKHNYFI